MHAVLLVVLTYAYATFSRSLAKKKQGVLQNALKKTHRSTLKRVGRCAFLR